MLKTNKTKSLLFYISNSIIFSKMNAPVPLRSCLRTKQLLVTHWQQYFSNSKLQNTRMWYTREQGTDQAERLHVNPSCRREMWQARRPMTQTHGQAEPGPEGHVCRGPGPTKNVFSMAYLSFPWSHRAHWRELASSDGNSKHAFWKRQKSMLRKRSHPVHEHKDPSWGLCQFCWKSVLRSYGTKAFQTNAILQNSNGAIY